ncbi:Uncharacterized protein dnl_29810 [Desulfonema limicola]|uniref:Uncharacterized protein n=1 Tax=Desulfonema limicola TaxID=45656 RepID=A0A975GGS3_9BACT|nr:hypothetical protein [Desulfonema limicola]QTA80670.1 Uncharacterized protein dnl_29810 [Desulfonema limicola]
MAVFQIIASRPIEKKDFDHRPELDVKMISGELKVDDTFILYETHHPFEVIIRKLENNDNFITVSVSCSVRYEGWHVGTIVDTENPEAGRKFGYRTKDAAQLYHPDVLKKYRD